MEKLEHRLLFAGTWSTLANAAPGAVGTMLLLPDGTVMATTDGDGAGSDWARLTPSSTGSYVNGTWTKLANANDTRLFDTSVVLQNGGVFVAGGEYGTGGSTGEVYTPLTNTWTRAPAQPYGTINDAWGSLIANGSVLDSPVGPNPGGYTTLFNPATNTWAQGPKLYRGGSSDEQSWVKLADGSILTVDGSSTSERYIPAQNAFVNDGTVPVPLSDGLGEYGPGFLLANGKALFIGADGKSVIYTPTGTAAPGSWVAGPTLPGGLGEDDASGAVLRDGTVLVTAGPIDSYNGPTTLDLYDPVANTFTVVPGPNNYGGAAFLTRMLALPNGDVLYSENGSTLYQYDPGTSALAAATPVVTSIAPNADGSLTVTGSNLNGINSGAEYGDDAQMDSNYPILRLTSGSNVYYGRSYNWTNNGVMLGSTAESVTVRLPVGIPAGTYSAVITANGVASAATNLTVSTTTGNAAPSIAAAASAPATSTGTTAALSVLGADDAGEPNLTYTWVNTGAPSGVSLAGFSVNGTNSAKTTTAVFHQTGAYTFVVNVADAGGLSVNSSSVTVVVGPTLTSVAVSPALGNITVGQTQRLTATGYDQFANALGTQPAFTWAVTAGTGAVSPSGVYTAPAAGTLATVTATTGSFSATTTVAVVNLPWTSADVGAVGIAGTAYDSGATTTLTNAGDDIWNAADAFHFDYQLLAGDSTITAKLGSETSASTYIKAGVMIRNTLDAGSAMAMVNDPAGYGPSFEWRTAAGATAAQTTPAGNSPPEWLRLSRVGALFTAYTSPDGVTWTSIGSQTITMNANVYVGLALCSHNSGALATATFTNVTVTSNQTLTSVRTLSSPVNLTGGRSQQLIAAEYDQNGFLMSAQPAFTWAVTSGAGTVTAGGAYTGPAAGTLATVTATAGGFSAAATVAVVKSPWISTDVGNVAAPGTAYDSSATTTLTDTSDDIWNQSDDFHFDYQTMTGDGSITAQLLSQVSGSGYIKAGVMIRNSLAPNDAMAMVCDPAPGPLLEWRTAASGTAAQTATTTSNNLPYWLRLVRAGTLFSGYSSPDGSTWTLIGTQTISMGLTVDVGLALTSHDTGNLATAAFTNVSISNPTVATPAAANPSPVTGTTTALSVLGSHPAGESTLTYTWAATTVPAGAPTPTFSGNHTNAAKNTVATFGQAGTYAFTVTITDSTGQTVTTSVGVTVNQTLTAITLSPATAPVHENGTQTFVASGVDQFGAATAPQPTFTWAKTAGIGSVSAAGVYTSPAAAGSATVQASSGSIFATASVTVTNAAPTVATAAAASPSTATGASVALSVLGADDGGEANLIYAWAATAIPNSAPTPTFNPNGTNGAKAAIVTFYKAGNYLLTATIIDASGLGVTSTFSVSVVQTLTSIVISPTTVALNENGTQSFSAVADDQFGNALPTQPTFSWTKTAGIGSINSATGLYTAPAAAGSATVQASSGSVNATAAVTVTNAVPRVATAAAASPNPLSGTTTTLSVLGSDDGGEPNLTYIWTVGGIAGVLAPSIAINGNNAAKTTPVTFYSAGNYSFTAHILDSAGLSVTSVVSVTVAQTVTSITVSPSAASVGISGTQLFTAAGIDQFGKTVSPQPAFLWTKVSGVGSINSGTGAYAAGLAAGSSTIQASYGGISATATVTVSNAAPTIGAPAAASPITVTGTTTSLSVLGADDGGEANLTYLWSTTGAPTGAPAPTFSVNGTNGAKNTIAAFAAAGNYTFTVTVTDSSGLSTTSVANVTVAQTLTGLTLAGPVAGGTSATALAADQFGNPFTPAVTWSVTGGGTISTSGVFTANQSGGSYAVTATATGGTSASTGVSVVPTIYAGPTGSDTYAVRLSPTDGTVEQIFVNAPESGAPTYSIPVGKLPSLTFAPTGGDGSVTVDFANGNPLPAGGVSYAGGPRPTAAGNTLFVVGSASGNLGFSIDGGTVVTGSATGPAISYANVQAVEFDLRGGSNSLTQSAQPSAPVTFNAGPGANTLTVNGGTFGIAADPATADGQLTVNDNASLTFAPGATGGGVAARNLAALNFGANATAVAQTGNAQTDRLVLVVGGLTLGAGSQLDLGGNDMIVRGGNLPAVTAALASGYSFGSWSGTGINSARAANDATHLTALGVIQNTDGANPIYPSFDGQSGFTSDVLIRYTYTGDANLSGAVDGSDYSLIDSGFASAAGTGWANGNFDYAGIVDGTDYTLIDNAFNNQAAALPAPAALVAGPTAVFAPAAVATFGFANTSPVKSPTAIFPAKVPLLVESARAKLSAIKPVAARPIAPGPFYAGTRKIRHAPISFEFSSVITSPVRAS